MKARNRNFFKFLLLIILAVSVYFILPKLIGLERTIGYLRDANKFYLTLGLCFEILSYSSAAWFLGVVLSRSGNHISFKDRFRISSIGAFAIHFLPVASFGEGIISYYFLKKRGIPSGKVLLLFLLRLIFSYAAFLALFVIGLILVPTHPTLSFSPKLISFLLFLAVLGGVIYLIYLYRHKEKFFRIFKRFAKTINFFLVGLNLEPKDEIKTRRAFEDLYEGVGKFPKKKRTFLLSFLSYFFYWFLDASCFFFIFLSFGYVIHPGILIFTYGIATLAGLISFIPGGLGVTEGSLALIFSALGVPFSLAIISILVFRLFSFWIWVPIGLVSYLTLRREDAQVD